MDIRADVLMYCTYTLGRWDSDVKVDFKDGNVHNLHPSNLMRHISQPPPEHAERVSRFSDIYRRYYDEVVRFVSYVGDIPVEDARDIASQQYLLLTTVAFYTGFSKELWIHMCKLAAGNHRKKYTNRLVRGEIMDDLRDFDINGEHAETDLLAPLNDRERLVVSMWARGHRNCDIVEELGIKKGTVSVMIMRALRKLRKHFRRDAEIYRKENL